MVIKTKYMVMSRDQNAGRSHNINNDNKSFEIVEQFKYENNCKKSKFYAGRKQEQIEVRECLLSLGAGSLYFSILSKNVKIKIY
jgi:hypothetical protein